MKLPESETLGPRAHEPAVRWRPVLISLATTVLGTVLLWWICGRLLGSTRGLELTDEGLYLLAADPPSAQAAWGFPFGWHTGPLFRAVGYDIASFRTAGAVILVWVSAIFGWTVAVSVLGRKEAARRRDLHSELLPLATGATGAIGCLLYYAAMLRTPSYNWVNLIGIMLTSIAVMHLARTAQSQPSPNHRVRAWSLYALASFGLFLTIPAKPTTVPLLLALSLLFLGFHRGWKVGLRQSIAIGLLVPLWVLPAVILRVWPSDFVSVFRLALQMPLPSEYHTVSAAAAAALLTTRDFIWGLAALSNSGFFLLLLGVGLLLIPIIRSQPMLPVRIVGTAVLLLGALVVAGLPVPLVATTVEPFRWAHSPLTTACVLVLLTVLLANSASSRLPARYEMASVARQQRVLVVSYVALLPFVFGFGSDNGIYGQASVAAGFFLIASAVATISCLPIWYRMVLTGAILLMTATLAAAGLYGGWMSPYRMEPLGSQVVPLEVGVRGSNLQVDPALAATLQGLREKALDHGWTPETPIVDVSYTWHPGVPYFLGGRVPNFLQLTIFGYATTHDITAFHLRYPYVEFPLADAWIVTTKPSLLEQDSNRAVAFTLDALSGASGRSFPSGYGCLESGEFNLWYPIPTRPGTATPARAPDCLSTEVSAMSPEP